MQNYSRILIAADHWRRPPTHNHIRLWPMVAVASDGGGGWPRSKRHPAGEACPTELISNRWLRGEPRGVGLQYFKFRPERDLWPPQFDWFVVVLHAPEPLLAPATTNVPQLARHVLAGVASVHQSNGRRYRIQQPLPTEAFKLAQFSKAS